MGKKQTTEARPQFRALVGMNYADRRVEPGEIVSDIPETSIAWLLEQGLIEPVAEQEA